LVGTGKGKYIADGGESKTVKWTIIVSSAASGLIVDLLFPGWGRPLLLTLLIFASLILFCRSCWSTAFWIVVGGTFAVHSLVVLRFRATIGELPLTGLFLCAVAEVIVIAVVLGLVFPDKKESQLRN
jgi:hypothetical protein